MSNHFPSPIPSFSVGSVDYVLTQSHVGGSAGVVNGPGVPMLTFSPNFDTGTVDGSGNEIYDYSAFDQDTVEAAIKSVADAIAAATVDVTGVSSATAKAAISITRQWYLNPDQHSTPLSEQTAMAVETVTYP